MFFGLALIFFAAFLEAQRSRQRRLLFAAFLLQAAGAVMFFILELHRGGAFARKALPLWFWILIVGTWLGCTIAEFLRWRKSKSATAEPLAGRCGTLNR